MLNNRQYRVLGILALTSTSLASVLSFVVFFYLGRGMYLYYGLFWLVTAIMDYYLLVHPPTGVYYKNICEQLSNIDKLVSLLNEIIVSGSREAVIEASKLLDQKTSLYNILKQYCGHSHYMVFKEIIEEERYDKIEEFRNLIKECLCTRNCCNND